MEPGTKLNQEFQKIADRLSSLMDLCESKEYVLGLLIYRHLSERFEDWWEKHKDKSLDDPEMFDGDDYEGKTHERVAKRLHGYFIKQEHLFSEMLKKAHQHETLYKELLRAFVAIEETNLDMMLTQRPLTSIRLNSDKLGPNIKKRNKTIIEIMSVVSCLDLESISFEEMYKGLASKYISLESEGLMPPEVSRLLVELTRADERQMPTKIYRLFPIKSFFQKTILKDRACLGWINFEVAESGYDEKTNKVKAFLGCEYSQAWGGVYDEEFLFHEEYKKYRLKLMSLNQIDTVILLPEKLFKDTAKSRYIVIIKRKECTDRSFKTLFINASEFFIKEEGINKLEEAGIQKILNYYKRKIDVSNYVYSANYSEMAEKDYDFSVLKYISKQG